MARDVREPLHDNNGFVNRDRFWGVRKRELKCGEAFFVGGMHRMVLNGKLATRKFRAVMGEHLPKQRVEIQFYPERRRGPMKRVLKARSGSRALK